MFVRTSSCSLQFDRDILINCSYIVNCPQKKCNVTAHWKYYETAAENESVAEVEEDQISIFSYLCFYPMFSTFPKSVRIMMLCLKISLQVPQFCRTELQSSWCLQAHWCYVSTNHFNFCCDSIIYLLNSDISNISSNF